MKKISALSIFAICTLFISSQTPAQSIASIEKEDEVKCTSATVNMFGILETATRCSDGSGSIHRTNIAGTYSCIEVWDGNGRELYNSC